MAKADTRQAIVEKADDLFYRQGFEATSFADIAKLVGISRGNFYHHFKSKDEILESVIVLRKVRTKQMLENWEIEDSPFKRISRFVNILIDNQQKIMENGCPVGSLCTELAKLEHESLVDAAEIFLIFHHWLVKEFKRQGCEEADKLSMHLLSRSQGIAVMANTFKDNTYVRGEVDSLIAWVGDQLK